LNCVGAFRVTCPSNTQSLCLMDLSRRTRGRLLVASSARMGEHNARFHSRAILGIAVVFVAAGGTVCLWAGPYHQKQLLEKAEEPSQQVRVASLEETGESGRSIDMEEEQGGMDQRSGGQRLQPSRGDKLPRCYFSPSSPDASPSEGAWRSCPNGVRDSPAYRDDWELPSRPFGFLKK